jgi:long-chain acyl-CoA synthetase
VFEGVTVEIRDESGRPLPRGETGEIVVRSAHPPGYVDDEDATRELVVDGWVHSGDVGYVDEDDVLFIVGRKREMIKCGGFQVWPQEIEDELRAHPSVRDIRVIGVPHERLGEIPQAQVVREPSADQGDDALREELVAFARERLAHFKAPREVVFVGELPRSEVGKVRRGREADVA